jgi:uncharacterized protein YyaL (SSP411 family)
MPNRLAAERSPYLLQHAENPVDWYRWGDEAFARARLENKPIFLSIGYSTCHWCHVMAHESFEDPETAALINRHFIAVKVDREERPDVDRVYMLYVQSTTGAGGWPMSVWLTPGLKPFFGGTYFPPASRWGRPAFSEVLEQIAESWATEGDSIRATADDVLERLREASGAGAATDSAPVAGIDAVTTGVETCAAAFDSRHGGFGAAPKFPRPSELTFLLHAYAVTGQDHARTMALATLRAMGDGGVRDHIGGGFHRYSVDAEWRVPHFEKMLYDQAQLVLAYVEATQASGDVVFAEVAEDTLRYVARDMTAPEGGFYSAEDADSLVSGDTAPGTAGHEPPERREGAFYVWTKGELVRLLGPDEPMVSRRFGIEVAGNALADPQGEFSGVNIPYVAQSINDVAAFSGHGPLETIEALGRARRVLHASRDTRPRPHLDDKILAAWNGLMIAAFARSARVLVDSPSRGDWRGAAERAADWVQRVLWRGDRQRLLRRYRDGESAIDAYCEDYACLTWGLLELFQLSGHVRWLTWATEVTRVQLSLFFDPRDGGWFSTTGDDESILLRVKEDYDGAEPAAASVSVRNLITLGRLTGETEFDDYAGRTLERYGPHIGRAARVMPLMLANVALWHGGDIQIVIVGPAGATSTRAFERVIAARHLPWVVVVPVTSAGHATALGAVLPWVAGMWQDGEARVFLCDGFVCQAPQSDADVVGRLLDEIVSRRTESRR